MKTEKEYYGIGRVPVGIGAVLKGWDLTEEQYKDPNILPVVDFRAMTQACVHDCFHCFTDKNKKTLTLDEIKDIIDQLSERNTHTIDFLGEGEPTLDKDFFEIVEHTSENGIIPIVFTDGATRLLDRDFVKRLYDSGASVVPKCDSLFSPEYQNWIVGDRTNTYFEKRNKAIGLLIEEGFNEIQEDGTTRMGFDMVVSRKNYHEVEETLRYCREKNLWIVFSSYLPSGRSGREDFDKELVLAEKQKEELADTIRKIDSQYGFNHTSCNNFFTTPCIEYMQIFGDGRVSPCPGNEIIIGNLREQTLNEIETKMLERFPNHKRACMDGNCLYREKN
jgi:MoaA/NifB/PqqE/SkfB family radical SAM enzyme